MTVLNFLGEFFGAILGQLVGPKWPKFCLFLAFPKIGHYFSLFSEYSFESNLSSFRMKNILFCQVGPFKASLFLLKIFTKNGHG